MSGLAASYLRVSNVLTKSYTKCELNIQEKIDKNLQPESLLSKAPVCKT